MQLPDSARLSILRDMASEWPGDGRLAERVASVFVEGSGYEFERLVDLVEPASRRELKFLLAWLVSRGLIKLIYRVESPERHVGIEDFASIEDVPERIFDWSVDRDIDVTPQNLRTVYEPA